MNQHQEIFDELRKDPNHPDDPDLRLDFFGYTVERNSYGAEHSYGWRIDEKGRVVGNIAGRLPKMARRAQHVVPRGSNWAVRKTGANRATRKYKTQGEAIKAACGFARNQQTAIYIYGRDGRIRERISYENDQSSPKG